MGLFQTGLFWNGRRCVFVEWAPVAREVELLVDSDILIAEDLPRPEKFVCQVTPTPRVGTSLTDDTALRDQE